MLSSSDESIFLPGTLKHTDIQVRGMDKKLHKADAKGVAQLTWHSRQQNAMFRITTEGILTKKSIPDAFTIVSVPQLNYDGVALYQAKEGETPYLHTGPVFEPSLIANRAHV